MRLSAVFQCVVVGYLAVLEVLTSPADSAALKSDTIANENGASEVPAGNTAGDREARHYGGYEEEGFDEFDEGEFDGFDEGEFEELDEDSFIDEGFGIEEDDGFLEEDSELEEIEGIDEIEELFGGEDEFL